MYLDLLHWIKQIQDLSEKDDNLSLQLSQVEIEFSIFFYQICKKERWIIQKHFIQVFQS